MADNTRTQGSDELDHADRGKPHTQPQEAQGQQELTSEIGSEGGSPGETKHVDRAQTGTAGGSEATETWSPDDDRSATVDHRDETGRIHKRNP